MSSKDEEMKEQENNKSQDVEKEKDETIECELQPAEMQEKIERLEEQVDSLEEENQKYLNKLKRSQADFANYRRRTREEKADLAIKYKVEIIEQILPVLDNFERALASGCDDDGFSQGVEMIYRQLWTVLKQEGVKEITAVGEEFDHKYHEAVEKVESEEEEGTVIEEVQKGYLYEDVVVRPAMVKVAG
ncbi:nucleotide exchange factor GrpE [Halanaerobiaceae bacterium Z-7014]|uniref:Protein GrpE n=1 Tax=Halonatronomonas betaini TaxID=2778430 RepID=A0A931ANE8_9FIRM|nr:nucleotide exchange factor GrpE [Halonatronomonas betaini]MBF8436008.1 nucleotide exchange factor GrpE [Halonatronomonas betaini]